MKPVMYRSARRRSNGSGMSTTCIPAAESLPLVTCTSKPSVACGQHDLQRLARKKSRIAREDVAAPGAYALDVCARRKRFDGNVIFRQGSYMLENKCAIRSRGSIDSLIKLDAAAHQLDVAIRKDSR